MRDVLAHVRAYAIPRLPARDVTEPARPPRHGRWTPQRLGARVLVFDVETTADAAQRLFMGAYRLYEWVDGDSAYRLLEEGLIAGDGLPGPQAVLLRRYAKDHHLPLLSRQDFAVMLSTEGHDLGTLVLGFNLKYDLAALMLPLIPRRDGHRIRHRPGWGRGRQRWRRGFRLTLLNAMSRPKLLIRAAGPGSAFIEWAPYAVPTDGMIRTVRPFKGRWGDLREWVHALTGETHTLASAAARFGLAATKGDPGEFGRITRELLDYCRRDVALTWALFGAVREEWNRHPFTTVPSARLSKCARAADTPELSPDAVVLTRMHSPASLVKGYLDRMGLRPRLEIQPDFPREALAQAFEAFYGGRIEVRPDLQGAVLPVITEDIVSTYLSMNVLLELHRWDSAAQLRVVDVTADTRKLLATLTIEKLLPSDVWPQLAIFCEVELRDGDLLPVRFPESPADAPTCHLKHVCAGWPGQTLWYALPDLLYSMLATERPPIVRRAWRLVPEGKRAGLRSVRFRGGVTLDPRTDYLRDFRDERLTDVQPRLQAAEAAGRFNEAGELERLQRAMKAAGEPLGYGVYVEVDEKDLLARELIRRGAARAAVWTGRGHFETRITREEYPGRWFFSPRGAIVTSAARLALGMKELLVTRAGGSIVSMHTDSVAVVAMERGGEVTLPPRPGEPQGAVRTVRALPFTEVDRIRAQVAALSGIPGVSLWKREGTNDPHPDATRDRSLYMLSFGPGRYALFNRADDGRVILRDRKETALGHLIPPLHNTSEQAMDAVWDALIREALGDHKAIASLPFARAPALGRLPITTPDLLWRIRTRPRGGRAGASTPRPFGFFTVAYTMTDQPLFGRHSFWSGWCRLKKKESVGCPTPREACPHRAACPLALPIQPATFDIPKPGGDLLREGQWFDAHTGRPLPRLHTMPVDTWPQQIRVRTWAEYVRYTLARGAPWWRDQDPYVRVIGLVYTGKEGRHLEDIAASLRAPRDEVIVYAPEPREVEAVREGCFRHPTAAIARAAQLSRRTIERFRTGTIALLDPAPFRRLHDAVVRLDVQPDQDEPLRAAIRNVPVGFLAEQTLLDRVSVWRFQRGYTRRLHPANRALLWQAYSAWLRDHNDTEISVQSCADSVALMCEPPRQVCDK